jgi:ABC-type sugar transport system substrate-binding protein
MGLGKLAAFLTEESNPYQRLLKRDAEEAAQRHGFSLQVTFCSLGVARQVQQLRDAIAGEAELPRAILVMPAQEGTLLEQARDAARAKIAWVVLNRRAAFLQRVPDEFPEVPIFAVTPDDVEIGKIQSRQLRALLPSGSRALLVRGGSGTSTTVERELGLRSGLPGSGIELEVVYGSWTQSGARTMLGSHLARRRRPADALVCQSDAIALGALEALETASTRLGRPDLRGTRILGCDGLPEEGRRHVDDGRFAATVIVPSTTGPAISTLSDVLRNGATAPSEITLPCRPYPP